MNERELIPLPFSLRPILVPPPLSSVRACVRGMQVVPSKETSSVYSFLGTITKDHGQIDASVELLEVSRRLSVVASWACDGDARDCIAGPAFFRRKYRTR